MVNFNPAKDIPDLSGKVVLVTGGNVGLGAESVLQLAKHNAQIYLAARTPAKAEAAIAKIKQAVSKADIKFLELDLASFESVKKAADRFSASSIRLDILMNNAGVMALPPGMTKEGYEIQFGTNHMGHALLTKLLLPSLRRTAEEPGSDVRIINVSSVGHTWVPKSGLLLNHATTTMESYSTWTRYGQSKLANVLFTRELSRRYPNIKSVSLHPGSVDTQLSATFAKNHPILFAPVHFFSKWAFKTPQQGALTQLWAATSTAAKSGTYYVPTAKEHPGSPLSQSKSLSGELWEWTEKELAKHGYGG